MSRTPVSNYITVSDGVAYLFEPVMAVPHQEHSMRTGQMRLDIKSMSGSDVTSR